MATNGPRVSCHSSVSVHFVSVFMKVILYSLFISNTRTFRTFWYVLGSAEWEWPGQNRTIHVLFVVAMWRWSRRFSKREENPDQLTHPTQSQSIDLGSGVSDVYLALLLCLCFLYLLLGDKQENYSLFIWRMIVMYVDKSILKRSRLFSVRQLLQYFFVLAAKYARHIVCSLTNIENKHNTATYCDNLWSHTHKMDWQKIKILMNNFRIFGSLFVEQLL